MGATVEVTISPELQATLSRMEAVTRGETLTKALTAGALLVENAAKANAPVKSGTLRRSITTQPAGSLAVSVGPRGVPYARRIEFGFVGTDSLGRHYHQAPRPYLRPALDAQAAAAVEAVGHAIEALIRSAA